MLIRLYCLHLKGTKGSVEGKSVHNYNTGDKGEKKVLRREYKTNDGFECKSSCEH